MSVPCAICEAAPGTVAALRDEAAVLVCRPCFAYETGELEPDQVDDDEPKTRWERVL